jgi:ubiquinol-cytochrome c reductase iron-sulfur subunit
MTSEKRDRRNFLYLATGAFAAVGGGLALWPMVAHLKPSDIARPRYSFDFSRLKVGEHRILKIGGLPWIARHRTADEISASTSVPLKDLAIPTDTRVGEMGALENVPATDEHRSFGTSGEYVIFGALCPREGCLLSSDAGDFAAISSAGQKVGGWFCPCCAAHFDTLGRCRKGPVDINMQIPQLRFSAPSRIEVDELQRGYVRLT